MSAWAVEGIGLTVALPLLLVLFAPKRRGYSSSSRILQLPKVPPGPAPGAVGPVDEEKQ